LRHRQTRGFAAIESARSTPAQTTALRSRIETALSIHRVNLVRAGDVDEKW
jgi:hypothetical protein